MSIFVDKPVRTVMRYAVCDCGGQLSYTGTIKLIDPPLYVHECDKCGASHACDTAYPSLAYEEEA